MSAVDDCASRPSRPPLQVPRLEMVTEDRRAFRCGGEPDPAGRARTVPRSHRAALAPCRARTVPRSHRAVHDRPRGCKSRSSNRTRVLSAGQRKKSQFGRMRRRRAEQVSHRPKPWFIAVCRRHPVWFECGDRLRIGGAASHIVVRRRLSALTVDGLSPGHAINRRAAIARIRRSAGCWPRTDLAGIPSGLPTRAAGPHQAPPWRGSG
jgi:hypothetical protein